MPGIVPVADRPADPGVISALLRRQKEPEKLYWRLRRPGVGVYARAVGRIIIYRAAAALTAIFALVLCAFIGTVAGDLGYLRPSPFKSIQALKSIRGETLLWAEANARTEISRWVPALIVLGLIMVAVPQAGRWFFRLALLGAVGIGYYQKPLPRFPRSTLSVYITRQAASFAKHIPVKVAQTQLLSAVLPLILVAVVAYVLYRYSYRYAQRSVDLIPHRPVNHYHSVFSGVRLSRRLAAVPITAVLLSADVWLAENARGPLGGVHFGVSFLGNGQVSPTAWAVIITIVALVICIPHPRGLQWVLIILIAAMTIYAFFPHVDLLPIPNWAPAPPVGFWGLAGIYALVTGFGFDLIAVLLDWPV